MQEQSTDDFVQPVPNERCGTPCWLQELRIATIVIGTRTLLKKRAHDNGLLKSRSDVPVHSIKHIFSYVPQYKPCPKDFVSQADARGEALFV
eukprot:1157479-Pelagomonas_calceolata.AAC.8